MCEFDSPHKEVIRDSPDHIGDQRSCKSERIISGLPGHFRHPCLSLCLPPAA